MRKLFFSLLALLALVGLAQAQVEIADKDRVVNMSPGYCAWCAIETLGRYHGVEKLVGLVESRQKDPDVTTQDQWGHTTVYKHNAGYDWTIRDKLDKLGVKYKMANTGSYDRELIRYAVKNNLGCACAVRAGALGDAAHAITVIDYDDKEVKYIDPNDLKTYTATRKWWDQWWDGWVLVVLPEEKTNIVVAQSKEAKTEEVKVAEKVVPPPDLPPPLIQWKYIGDKK